MAKIPLVLWGGTDVGSSYYKEERSRYAQHPDINRDRGEFAYVAKAAKDDVPVVGVCRGAQLLCVFNEGSLHQHTKPHTQTHSLVTYDGHEFPHVQAGHHQIMRPKGRHIVLAWNPSPVRIYNEDDSFYEEVDTPEVVWFPEFQHLAIQPHPEWSTPNDPFVQWINQIMKKKGIGYEFN